MAEANERTWTYGLAMRAAWESVAMLPHDPRGNRAILPEYIVYPRLQGTQHDVVQIVECNHDGRSRSGARHMQINVLNRKPTLSRASFSKQVLPGELHQSAIVLNWSSQPLQPKGDAYTTSEYVKRRNVALRQEAR
jgi:hypothetical protein